MSGAMSPIVVLGVGDLLRQDEGVGVHAVRALLGAQFEEWAQLVDGGTAVFEALSGWQEIGKLIVIDAVRGGRDPGSISRLSLREVADQTAPELSVHEHGLLAALGLLQRAGLRVGEVVIYGVEPESAGWGTDLSGPVAASLPLLAAHLRQEMGLASAEESPL